MDNDTIKLLRECNTGIQTAVASMKDVMENADSEKFREVLSESIKAHNELGNRTHKALLNLGEEPKEANPMAKGMIWFESSVKTVFDKDDKKAADIITEGCNMGIKSLNRYLNEYKNADNESKNLVEELISMEENLRKDICIFL